MINLRTTAAKRREAAQQVRLSLTLERTIERKLRAEFKRVARAAAAALRRQHDVGKVLPGHRQALTEILTSGYRAVSRAFFARARASLGKAAGWPIDVKAPPPTLTGAVVATSDADTAYTDLWSDLTSTIGERVDQISGTTREQIQREIADGVRDGVSWDDIADGIEESTGGLIGGARAEMIARTEAHSVSQASTMAGAESMGLALSKEWVAVEDDRTRPDHAEADGEDIAMDDQFLVGGAPMRFPGDPSGPPEQVINCRCAVVFNVQE